MKVKREWFWVIIWSAFVVFLANLPHLYGYLATPPGKIFTGDARCYIDISPYISWIHQAKDGHLLFKDLYTTEPQARLFFHPLFLILGNMARFAGISTLAIHSAARVVLGFLLLLLAYVFTSYFLEDVFKRWLAFILISISGGFGWLTYFPSISKINESWFLLGWIEGNTFLTLYVVPLFTASVILLLLSFYFSLKASETKKMKYAIYGGIAGLFLVWTHYFDFMILFPVLFLFFWCKFFVSRRVDEFLWDLKVFLVVFIFSLPAVLYDLLAAYLNPVFFQHTWKGAVTLSPSLIWYLGGLGFVGIFALMGIFDFILSSSKMDEKQFNKFLFLVVWCVSIAFLIYFPIPFQRRLVEGVHIPFSILATCGFTWVVDKLKWDRKIASSVLILLVIPNILITYKIDMSYLRQNARGLSMAGYLTKDIAAAYQWLEDHTSREAIVLCDFEVGNYIPAISGNMVYIGHSPLTLNFWGKWALVKRFFSESESDEFRIKFLKDNKIAYVFYGFREKALGGFDPAQAPFLKRVYQNQTVQIFQVK